MKKELCFFALLTAFLIPSVSSAQKLERTKNWEVGDKVTWNYVLKWTSMRFVEEVVAVIGAEIRSTLRVGDRTFEQRVSTRDLSYLKGICWANGQVCEFSPGEVWFDFPLEKGKTWSGTTTVTGETFIVDLTYQSRVEALEKINTPAGEFEAYTVSGTERIRTGSGSGMANLRYWLAAINGKLVCVKNEYKNPFGEFFTRELLSAELK
jgi:hypothetical protein